MKTLEHEPPNARLTREKRAKRSQGGDVQRQPARETAAKT